MTPLLSIRGLSHGFGRVDAVSDFNLELPAGIIYGLIGPSGAGKTTSFNLITGLQAPRAGRILFNGHDITGAPPFRIEQWGIARTFQNPMRMAGLSRLEQRHLEVTQALATEPKLILLDEPAAGLNAKEVEALIALIHRVRDEYKVTVLLSEHHMKVVMGTCEAVKVLAAGATIAEGPPREVGKQPRVRAAYLGGVPAIP